MHAHVISVSFPCVDLSCLGSPEPQKIKLKRTKAHAFIFVPITSNQSYRTNQTNLSNLTNSTNKKY